MIIAEHNQLLNPAIVRPFARAPIIEADARYEIADTSFAITQNILN